MAHHRTPSEHEEQVALIEWAEYASGRWPELVLLFAIPNGGLRPARERIDQRGRRVRFSVEAQKLRDEGVRSGVPDLSLPVPSGPFHGLYIEMKTRTGSLSKAQRQWLAALSRQGYRAEVCHGFEQARRVIVDYLGAPTKPSARCPRSIKSLTVYPAPRDERLGIPEAERTLP